jgi:hypothetical protein
VTTLRPTAAVPFAALLTVVSVIAGVVVASPAQAASRPLFGTTVEVIAEPSGDSLLGGIAHLPAAGGTLWPTLAAPTASEIAVDLVDRSTVVGSCVIRVGAADCGIATTGLFGSGSNVVTLRFTASAGGAPVEHTGTILAVTTPVPSVAIQWRDAAGTWIDGTSVTVPLFGESAMRCAITNNSNAPMTFDEFEGTHQTIEATTTVILTGAVAAGATGYYPIWSGVLQDPATASCAGSVVFRDGTSGGNGDGGAVIPIGGTISVDRDPAPGTTVTVTGVEILPPMATEFTIELDGVDIEGSPVVIDSPDWSFAAPVEIPATLEPGSHAITVRTSYLGRSIAFAHFSFEVAAPQLAETGPVVETPVMSTAALLLLLAGTMIVIARRRRASRV